MMYFLRTLFIIYITCITSAGIAQVKKPILAPAENWVRKITPDLQAKIDENEAEGGTAYLLIDVQENISLEATYCHYAYKILNSEGSQSMSDIDVSFDPSYQKLFFHSIILHRNGRETDILKTHQFESYRREVDKDRYLYDGTIANIINIKDIREGDIIEFSYTRKGYNPLKKEKFSTSQLFNYSIPVHHQYYSVLAPAKRELFFSYNKTDVPKPKETTSGTNKIYEWDIKNLRPILSENFAPAWYNPYQQVIISEYKNWEEVVNWALPLYTLQQNELTRIKNLYGEKIDSTDDLSIAKAIRFVQDEIRYLGFESGMGSYKPNKPEIVFNHRFGDCKDKSLLLVSILKSAGIRAYPMLVNSTITSELDNHKIASPDLFDHCVVNISVLGSEYYIDPTFNYQGGTLGNIHFPRYHYGLVIRDGEKELRKITPTEESIVRINETYIIDHVGGNADYKIVTEYDNEQANMQRSFFKSSSNESISKGYVDFYGKIYPKIKLKEKLKFSDDKRIDKNIFTVTEQYIIENFWTKNAEDSTQLYVEFFPLVIHSFLNSFTSSERTSPFALQNPVHILQETTILLPEPWDISPTSYAVDHPCFSFSFSAIASGDKTIILSYDYLIKKEYVSPEEFPDFFKKQNEVRNNISYYLSKGGTETATSSFSPYILITISGLIFLALCTFFSIKIYYAYDPIPDPAYTPYSSIGGWLILIAFGIIVSPFTSLYNIFGRDSFIYVGELYGDFYNNAFILSYVIFFLAIEIIHWVFSIFVGILFFQRRSSFPKIFICLIIFRVLSAIINLGTVIWYDEPIDEHVKEVIKIGIAAAIWIPYFSISSRVHGTFIKRLKIEQETDIEQNQNPSEIANYERLD